MVAVLLALHDTTGMLLVFGSDPDVGLGVAATGTGVGPAVETTGAGVGLGVAGTALQLRPVTEQELPPSLHDICTSP
jgi:hypothetical protein